MMMVIPTLISISSMFGSISSAHSPDAVTWGTLAFQPAIPLAERTAARLLLRPSLTWRTWFGDYFGAITSGASNIHKSAPPPAQMDANGAPGAFPGKACGRLPAAFITAGLHLLLQVIWNCVFPAGGRFWLAPSAVRGNGWADYERPELRDLHQPSRFRRGKGMCLCYPDFVKIEFWFG